MHPTQNRPPRAQAIKSRREWRLGKRETFHTPAAPSSRWNVANDIGRVASVPEQPYKNRLVSIGVRQPDGTYMWTNCWPEDKSNG